MKVLITGGAGFVGSHLTEELLQRGFEVKVLDTLSTGKLENIEHFKGHPLFQCIVGSVLDQGILKPIVEWTDVIFHLAGAVGVKYIMKHSIEALQTNVNGTENVLKLAEQSGGKKVVIASTSEIYGKDSQVPYREEGDRTLGPPTVTRWGYSCSKALGEFLALAYHREKGFPTVILRLFNIVGPRQTGRYGMVVPGFVEQALKGEPITVYGDGEQKRCFAYVKDVAKAMVDISLVKEAQGEVFNVGSSEEISINELAYLVKRVIGSPSEIVHIPYREVYGEGFEDMRRRVPSLSKIQSYINYHPSTDLGGIIKEIAEDIQKR